MGCNCGKKRLDVGSVRAARLALDPQTSLYVLAAAPDCTDGYHGQFLSADVYVVDIGQPTERLFRRGDRVDARLYYKERRDADPTGATFNHLLARSLCHDSMVGLLGA